MDKNNNKIMEIETPKQLQIELEKHTNSFKYWAKIIDECSLYSDREPSKFFQINNAVSAIYRAYVDLSKTLSNYKPNSF